MADEQTNAPTERTEADLSSLGTGLGSTAAAPGLSPGLGDVTSQGSEPELETRPKAQPEPPDAQGWWWGTGRRKAAVARARIKPGSGEIKIQITRKKTKTVDEYFTELRDRNNVKAPLDVTGTLGQMDVVIRTHGGGFMGQAGAVMLAIARALKKYDPNFEDALRDHGLLTRDDREVERKKYGQAGARRRFQFSKR
jgi:small subunit ribosomal protein S9